VVLPAYNAKAYVATAIESVLNQSFRDFEFIIVDDGSTDGTAQVLDHYAEQDGRIQIVRRPNTGIVGALNDGLATARGEFIARMDADDIANMERFSKQIAYLEAFPDCVAVGASMFIIDPDGDAVRTALWSTDHSTIQTKMLRGIGGIPHPTAMIRRSALMQVGYYRKEMQYAEDLDLWLRLGEIGRLHNLPEILLWYREHAGSISATQRESQIGAIQQAVYAAHQRRGLELIAAVYESIRLIPPHRDVPFDWIGGALSTGYWQTAWKHTKRVARKHWYHPFYWLLPIAVWFGAVSSKPFGLWMRIRNAMLKRIENPPGATHPPNVKSVRQFHGLRCRIRDAFRKEQHIAP